MATKDFPFLLNAKQASVPSTRRTRRMAVPVIAFLSAAALIAPNASGAQAATAPAALFQSSYATASSSAMGTSGWKGEQEPSSPGASGKVATKRITVLTGKSVPTGAGAPTGGLRVELRPYGTAPGRADGDVQVSSGYHSNRAEVYGRIPAAATTTAPSRWPDPVNSVRWYDVSIYLPATFPLATDTKWLSLVQWKGLRGHTPPIAIDIKRNNFRLGGTRGNAGLFPNAGVLLPVARGRWTRFTVGMRLSPVASQGWVEVYANKHLVMRRTAVSNMDLASKALGGVDPIYLKEGIYRATTWTQTHVVFFGPTRVTTTKPAGLL